MREILEIDPDDAAPGEDRSRVIEAAARFEGRSIVDPRSAAFEEAWLALWGYFGPLNEIERRPVLERWLAEPLEQDPLHIDYHLVSWYERASGALAAVRDCYVGLDRARGHCVVFLSHSLVLPPWRRSGVARLVRTAPATLARRAVERQGLDPGTASVVLVAEMLPVTPTDQDSIVRLLSYGRAGFGVIPPSVLPYCQPDFRELAPGEEPEPIPMPLVVRRPGHEAELALPQPALPVALADAAIEQLALIHQRACEPSHVIALAEADRARLAALPGRDLPLLVLPTQPIELGRLSPLLRSRALLHYPRRYWPEPYRHGLPEADQDEAALAAAARAMTEHL